MRLLRFSALLLIFAGLMSRPAVADTVSIGFAEGGPITTVASAPGEASFTGAFGTFSNITAVGHGESVLTAPDLLLANTIDTATSSGGTLTIWITDQGLTSPSGMLPFESSFTANLVPATWTVDEKTFVSPTNALFSGNALDSTTFNAISTNVQLANAATGSTYSVSEEFVIHATGAGDANNTIDLSATPVSTPEPSLLVVLGLGLVGLGVMRRSVC